MIFLLPFGGIPDKHFHRVNDCFMPKWTRSIIIITDTLVPHRWCLHLIVVVGLSAESYAGGRVATGRVTHAGQVKG
jgi:hypothetical protein